MQAVDGDSAARMRKGDSRILKDCPCALQNPLEERQSSPGHIPLSGANAVLNFPSCRYRCATILQHWQGQNLIRREGIWECRGANVSACAKFHPGISISNAQRRPVPQALGLQHASRVPEEFLTLRSATRSYLAVLGRRATASRKMCGAIRATRHLPRRGLLLIGDAIYRFNPNLQPRHVPRNLAIAFR